MGKRLIVQRRGRGSPTFRAAKSGKVAPVKYPPLNVMGRGWVKELLHDAGRGAPLAYIALEEGAAYYIAAPEGIYVGQTVEIGPEAPVKVGNVLPLGVIPEGTMICNVEIRPGDGGKIARSSGSYAIVVSHTPAGTLVKLPSKKIVILPDGCRATVGVIAGGGRKEKPFMKAGEKYHLMRAKGHKYPKVRGVAMAAVSHPHGGGSHKYPGKPTTVSRHAPPGRKVGLIAARETGRKKRKRK